MAVFLGIVVASVSAFAKQIERKLKIRRLEHQIAKLSAPAKQPQRVEPRRVDQVCPEPELDRQWVERGPGALLVAASVRAASLAR